MNCELRTSLTKLCDELQIFLDKTEVSLFYSTERLNQVNNILKPWTVPNNDIVQECLCSTSVNIEENPGQTDLLDDITKTLHQAALVRSKSKKQTKNLRLTEKATTSKFKPKIKKSSSVLLTSTSSSEHNPSCPLFKSNVELSSKQSLNLSEAVSHYKIPTRFTKTIAQCQQLLQNIDNSDQYPENKSRDAFIKAVEKQNETHCAIIQKEDRSVKTFLTYLSALHTFETKRQKTVNNQWVFYTNKDNLERYQNCRFNIVTKHCWIVILNVIISDIIPVMENITLTPKEKLFLFRTLKTLCRYVYNVAPSVPVFRIKDKMFQND